jgi:DNA-directed RNA polymerase specialized sigma24 family protein
VATKPEQLLARASQGDANAVSELMPLVYDELRRLAASYIRRERRGQTLQATALVHEAYVRFGRQRDVLVDLRALTRWRAA